MGGEGEEKLEEEKEEADHCIPIRGKIQKGLNSQSVWTGVRPSETM